jgi:hypothetical protein
VPNEARQERVARNEALFREVNERIQQLTGDLRAGEGSLTIVCECGDGGCVDRLEVDAPTYERVRADAHRFIVASGHELPDVEDVVEELATCVIVSKRGPVSSEVAENSDPRS